MERREGDMSRCWETVEILWRMEPEGVAEEFRFNGLGSLKL